MFRIAAVALLIVILIVPEVAACTWKCNNSGTEFESCFDMYPWSAEYASCAARRQCMQCGQTQRCCITYCDGEMCMQI
jgi:hypothetical protein